VTQPTLSSQALGMYTSPAFAGRRVVPAMCGRSIHFRRGLHRPGQPEGHDPPPTHCRSRTRHRPGMDLNNDPRRTADDQNLHHQPPHHPSSHRRTHRTPPQSPLLTAYRGAVQDRRFQDCRDKDGGTARCRYPLPTGARAELLPDNGSANVDCLGSQQVLTIV